MSNSLAVGIDIGGTNLRGVLSNGDGEFLCRTEEKVNTKDKMAISRQIVDFTRKLCKVGGVELADLGGVGIASTGPMKKEEGLLIKPSNLPFEEVPLTEPVRKELNLPVSLLNDCIAGVLGEKFFGAGKEREAKNLVYINIGTGIGGGAVVDGNVLFGHGGNAAEIGHITIDPEMRLECGCGKKGHWEAYCSGRNIPNFVRMKFNELSEKEAKKSYLYRNFDGDLSKITSKEFFESVKVGDDFSKDILKEIGKMNAIGVSNVIDLFAPSLVVVGGSVALENPEEIIPPIKNQIKFHIRNLKPEIMLTPLEEDVELYGAVSEAFSQGQALPVNE